MGTDFSRQFCPAQLTNHTTPELLAVTESLIVGAGNDRKTTTTDHELVVLFFTVPSLAIYISRQVADSWRPESDGKMQITDTGPLPASAVTRPAPCLELGAYPEMAPERVPIC